MKLTEALLSELSYSDFSEQQISNAETHMVLHRGFISKKWVLESQIINPERTSGCL